MCVIISMKFVVEMHRFSFFSFAGSFAAVLDGIEFQTAHTSVNDEHLLAALKTCTHVSTALQ